MSPFRQIARGLRALTRRRVADQDLADEVQHYLELTVAAHAARGLSPGDARRAALVELGNSTVVREQVRAYGWENIVSTVAADLRFAARRLRRDVGFTVVAALTLAVGVGASTAIFSAVNPILFESLPYPRAKQIVSVFDVRSDGGREQVTFGTYRELLARARSFSALAVMRSWQPAMSGGALEPERIDGQRVSASYFRVLGVAPALGHDFDARDDRFRGPGVVMLSDGLWRRRFSADPSIVGREIAFADARFTVAGVMPPGFENVPAPNAELWSLLQYDASLPTQGREWGHHLRMIGRIRDGIGLDDAKRELDIIARTPRPELMRMPWASLEHGLIVSSLHDDVTRDVKPALLAVFGAVTLLLAIACVNVTNLLLARGAQRRGELAMRAALGAGRLRLVQQMLTESMLLALIGGAAGTVVAAVGVRALVALSPPGLPRLGAVRLDLAALAFAFVVTTTMGVIVGLVPALQAGRGDLQRGMQESSRRAVGGHRRMRAVLVVAEVALALMLLIGSGLLLRSLHRVLSVAPGFAPANIIAMQVRASGSRYDSDSATHLFFARALEAMRRVPGVTSAAFSSQLPLGGDEGLYGVHFESSPAGAETAGDAHRYTVSPGYVELMRIPLRRGRLLDEGDVAGAPLAALVSESLARVKFPGGDALGRRLRIGASDGPWFTIVGVVGDVKQTSLVLSRPEAAYVVDQQQLAFADRARWLVVRARGEPTGLTAALKTAIWSIDRNQVIVKAASMDALVAESVAQRRFSLIAFEAFALAALVLAAAGIYGVLSGSVAERMHELGVRSALGATSGRILSLVIGQGMTFTGIGVVLGVGAAVVASRGLETLLFGTSRLDPITYVGVVALLVGVSAVACWVPAARAARVDPASTLRAD